MKKLLILSGKGGTGKTTVAAAFIDFLNAEAFADCDVDAPNLHLVAGMNTLPERWDYFGSQKAFIDPPKCVGCGACAQICPQKLDVPGQLRKVAEVFEDGRPAG